MTTPEDPLDRECGWRPDTDPHHADEAGTTPRPVGIFRASGGLGVGGSRWETACLGKRAASSATVRVHVQPDRHSRGSTCSDSSWRPPCSCRWQELSRPPNPTRRGGCLSPPTPRVTPISPASRGVTVSPPVAASRDGGSLRVAEPSPSGLCLRCLTWAYSPATTGVAASPMTCSTSGFHPANPSAAPDGGP